MTAQSNTTTVELPPGVRHSTTTAFARSEDAYAALTQEAGWEERAWRIGRSDAYPTGWHVQKEAVISGCHIVVFPPRQSRPEQVVRDILAESMTPIVTAAEDEAFRERGWRESRLDRDDGRPVTEGELAQGYGLAVHADEIARKRRVPYALRRDLGLG